MMEDSCKIHTDLPLPGVAEAGGRGVDVRLNQFHAIGLIIFQIRKFLSIHVGRTICCILFFKNFKWNNEE